jgi:hypothetical protein
VDYYDIPKVTTGDFVRWVISYAVFTADDTGNVYPYEPIYCYGLVVEAANDGSPKIVVYIPRSHEYHMLDISKYNFEVLSSVEGTNGKNSANR